MKYKKRHFISVLPLIIITVLSAVAQEEKKYLPTLRGAEAIEKLKEAGQYDSLMDAVKTARQKDGQTNEPPVDDAVGQNTKLLASDAASFDYFGSSVAISGDTAVVGAYGESTAPNSANGAAYVFVKSGTAWTQQAKLTASDAASLDFFGISVAISGETIVVSAYGESTAPNSANGAAYVFVRSGTTWTEQAKLLASDAATSDRFGYSVGISGDTIVVGAWQESTAPNTANGAAYVFVRSGTTWTEQAKLLASDAATNDFFGISVGISGETIVVGAYLEDTSPYSDNGAAYVFVRSGMAWSQQAKLLASDPAGDQFGISVAISGETVVVGARGESTAPNSVNGAAYVFVRSGTTWSQQVKLLASDAASNDEFGYSVSISGEMIVVGAWVEDTAPNTNNGAAYVFVRSGTAWTQQVKLLASDAAANDQFGYSVAISGANIMVGARIEDTDPNTDNGATYAFRFLSGNWTQEAQKVASDGAAGDLFGYSVSISGDTAIVGAYNDDVGANTNQGSAYIFVRSGTSWTQQQKLTASDAAVNDAFGSSVAISGNTVIVGSPGDDVGANFNQGSAYIFIRSGITWTEQQKLTASDGAATEEFGASVAISGETAVVGNVFDTIGANAGQGSAHVFVRSGTTWTQQQKLTASDGASNDQFGLSVSISGNTVIVGAQFGDVSANANQGSAYVFVRSGTVWTEQKKLTASDGAANDRFGFRVAISDDTAIVGVFADDVGANTDQGSAYVFTRTGTIWTEQQKLTASDGAANDSFGWSVAVSGDTAIVGSQFDDVGANTDQGSAYVFTRAGNVWTQTQRLTATGGAASDRFGFTVAVSGDKIVVGAPFSDASTSSPLTSGKTEDFVPSATDQGAAYFFINTPLAPTAAGVSVSGRVLTPEGAGLRNAIVYLTKANGETVSTRTTTFGYYRFDDIAAGQTVIVGVSSKLYTFSPQVVQVIDNLADLDFTAQQP